MSPSMRHLVERTTVYGGAAILAFVWQIDLLAPQGVDLWHGIAFGAALLGGAAYYPMSILAVSMFDTIGAMNPLVVVPAMFRAAKEYATVLVLMAVIFGLKLGGEYVAGLLKIPFLPTFIASALGLYFLIVQMRMLGLMYYARREDLGWFGR